MFRAKGRPGEAQPGRSGAGSTSRAEDLAVRRRSVRTHAWAMMPDSRARAARLSARFALDGRRAYPAQRRSRPSKSIVSSTCRVAPDIR